MFAKFLLLFTLVPLVELWLLIKVGKIIGAGMTILLVAATGFYGVVLARSQGLQVLYRIQQDIRRGVVPTNEILDGACILVGGAFLLTPGLITDFLGFSLLFPVSRDIIKNIIKDILIENFKRRVF
ncbi:MAG: protein FxsA [Clostridia bacterium]|nr:protein FxsA [Clostridia bacterium]